MMTAVTATGFVINRFGRATITLVIAWRRQRPAFRVQL
jgi:hypothetical protein